MDACLSHVRECAPGRRRMANEVSGSVHEQLLSSATIRMAPPGFTCSTTPADRRLLASVDGKEIAESDRWAERGGLGALLRRKAGEGCFLPEASLPRNRRQRFMGECRTNGWRSTGACECHAWVEHWIKFCDGIGAEDRSEPPWHEPGFFEGAGGFDEP